MFPAALSISGPQREVYFPFCYTGGSHFPLYLSMSKTEADTCLHFRSWISRGFAEFRRLFCRCLQSVQVCVQVNFGSSELVGAVRRLVKEVGFEVWRCDRAQQSDLSDFMTVWGGRSPRHEDLY